jgi:hypothetical protein
MLYVIGKLLFISYGDLKIQRENYNSSDFSRSAPNAFKGYLEIKLQVTSLKEDVFKN